MDPNPFAAKLLESSAPAYAGFAVSLLLERHPEIEERFAPSAMTYWKTHMTQRVRELAVAITAGKQRLFLSRVDWARQAFQARGAPEGDLQASLECLREVLDEELPDAAKEEARTILSQVLETFAEPLPVAEIRLDADQPSEQLALEYLLAVLEGDSRRAIDMLLKAVEDGLGIHDAYLEVLLPAQQEVGRLWHNGELSVAEEHFVTATTRQAMSLLSRRTEPAPTNGKTVVAAAVAGNVHDLAVRVISDFFEHAGWRSVCLGGDVPVEEVADSAGYFKADAIVLSAALSVQLQTVAETTAAIRGLPDREVKVLVGGIAFAEAPELWQQLGADGYAATAAEAVALAANLVGLKSSAG